jgi:hypothetical protein
VRLTAAQPDAPHLAAFAAAQQEKAVAIDVRSAPQPHLDEAARAALADGDADAMREVLQPTHLFRAYADAKNLTEPMRAAAMELLERVALDGAADEPPPVRVRLSSVLLEGYGSFASRVEYPLAQVHQAGLDLT